MYNIIETSSVLNFHFFLDKYETLKFEQCLVNMLPFNHGEVQTIVHTICLSSDLPIQILNEDRSGFFFSETQTTNDFLS